MHKEDARIRWMQEGRHQGSTGALIASGLGVWGCRMWGGDSLDNLSAF